MQIHFGLDIHGASRNMLWIFASTSSSHNTWQNEQSTASNSHSVGSCWICYIQCRSRRSSSNWFVLLNIYTLSCYPLSWIDCIRHSAVNECLNIYHRAFRYSATCISSTSIVLRGNEKRFRILEHANGSAKLWFSCYQSKSNWSNADGLLWLEPVSIYLFINMKRFVLHIT